MIIANKYEVPDKCPDDCRYRGCVSQGDVCFRCPVMICSPFEYMGEMTYLVDPEGYRTDWAEEWEKWFKTGMVGLPDLRFTITK